MATLARKQFTVTDQAGNVVPGASVAVQSEEPGQPLVQLYSDRAGETAIGNPITADDEGSVAFHVVGGAFQIVATFGEFTRTWRYVPIGTAGEYDIEALLTEGSLGASNNLSDVADAATAFDNIKQAATAVYTGVVELATNEETQTGTDAVRAVTPAGLTATALLRGRHTIWMPAAAMTPKASNGGAPGSYATAGGIVVPILAFDTTTQEYAYFAIAMPKGWDRSTVAFVPYWTNAGGASTQNVVWSLAAVAISDDDPLDGTFGTAQTSDDGWHAQNDLHIGPESAAITVGGSPAANDLVHFQISRVVASDNMAGDALLLGVKVLVGLNVGNDA